VPHHAWDGCLVMSTLDTETRDVLKDAKVLIVDDEHFTRKVIHTLLLAIGCTKIFEAGDGAVGLEMVRAVAPDIVLLDWEMPGIDGAEFVRRVRSSDSFPRPNVPIDMLTGHGERSRVLEAVRLGVHGFLLKPVSSDTLQARILAVLTEPRKMMKRHSRYAPESRQAASRQPDAERRGADAESRKAAAKAAVDPAA
jgi:two-component system chemotaxis response regulator CheY